MPVDDLGPIVVRGRRALKKSFGGKTGVWWRADNYDDDEVSGGDRDGVEEVDAVNNTNNNNNNNCDGGVKEEILTEPTETVVGTSSDGSTIRNDGVISVGKMDGTIDDPDDEDKKEQEQEENNDDDDDDDDRQHQQQLQRRRQRSSRKSCWDDVQMGWDDDLCRPIYYHGSQTTSSPPPLESAHDSDSDDFEGRGEEESMEGESIDEHERDVSVDLPTFQSSSSLLGTSGGTSNERDIDGDDDDDDEEDDLSVEEEEETMPAVKKRRRNQQTFGRQRSKRRAIASLIVMDDHESEEEDISTSLSSPGSEPKPTTTNFLTEKNEDRQEQNNELNPARRVSTSPLRSHLTNGDAVDDANKTKISTFDFIAEDSVDEPSSSVTKTIQSRKGKKNTVNRVLVTSRKIGGHKSASSYHDAPNPRSSLDDARDYFAKLDQTHPLTLDNSETPVVSSRITRTIRGVDLTSPGLHVDYESYVEATVDSGVTPLPIEHFASSRRMNLRQRGDLFDGFLDVDFAGDN